MKTLKICLALLLWLALGISCKDTPTGSVNLSIDETDSVKVLTQALRQAPDDVDLLYRRAYAFFDRTEYDASIADLEKALTLDSTDLRYWHLLSDNYLNYHRPIPAMRTLEKAIAMNQEDIPTRLKLARLQIVLERYNDALKVLEEGAQIAPHNARIFLMKGLTYESQQSYEEAIDAYLTAAELEPNQADAWLSVGKLLDATADPRAEQYLQNALSVDTNNLESWLSLGNHYYTMGLLEQALATYDHIIRKDKQFAKAHLNSGLVCMDMKNYENAKERFYHAILMEPMDPAGYYYRGLASERMGMPELAMRDYQNALNLDADHERAKAGMIRVELVQSQNQ